MSRVRPGPSGSRRRPTPRSRAAASGSAATGSTTPPASSGSSASGSTDRRATTGSASPSAVGSSAVGCRRRRLVDALVGDVVRVRSRVALGCCGLGGLVDDGRDVLVDLGVGARASVLVSDVRLRRSRLPRIARLGARWPTSTGLVPRRHGVDAARRSASGSASTAWSTTASSWSTGTSAGPGSSVATGSASVGPGLRVGRGSEPGSAGRSSASRAPSGVRRAASSRTPLRHRRARSRLRSVSAAASSGCVGPAPADAAPSSSARWSTRSSHRRARSLRPRARSRRRAQRGRARRRRRSPCRRTLSRLVGRGLVGRIRGLVGLGRGLVGAALVVGGSLRLRRRCATPHGPHRVGRRTAAVHGGRDRRPVSAALPGLVAVGAVAHTAPLLLHARATRPGESTCPDKPIPPRHHAPQPFSPAGLRPARTRPSGRARRHVRSSRSWCRWDARDARGGSRVARVTLVPGAAGSDTRQPRERPDPGPDGSGVSAPGAGVRAGGPGRPRRRSPARRRAPTPTTMSWSPARCTAAVRQSNHAAAPSTQTASETGARPVRDAGQLVDRGPARGGEPVGDVCAWSSASTLTDQVSTSSSASRNRASTCTQNSSRGGSSETDVIALAVIACTVPAPPER